MSLITRMRREKAVYWKRGSKDRYQNYTYDAPVEIDCRWDDRAEEFIAPTGETKLSSAVVYVDRDMTPGDVLLFGDKLTEHDSYLGGANGNAPTRLPKAFAIQSFSRIANLKATEYLLTAYL